MNWGIWIEIWSVTNWEINKANRKGCDRMGVLSQWGHLVTQLEFELWCNILTNKFLKYIINLMTNLAIPYSVAESEISRH